MKKKRIIMIAAIILALILLFPIPIRYGDGGSIEYRSIAHIYSITKLHQLRPATEGGYDNGIEIRVFGITVFRHTKSATPLSIETGKKENETEPPRVRELITFNEDTWDGTTTLTIPEFAGVTFEYTSEKLTANGEDLIWGMPIFNVYLADLNGDGMPEICTTASYGSGICNNAVTAYDYHNKQAYYLSDRMIYDYMLSIENGELVVKQTLSYMQQADGDRGIGTGKLAIIDDELVAVGIDRMKPTETMPE